MSTVFAARRHPDDKPGAPLARIQIFAGPDPDQPTFTGQLTVHAWQAVDLIERIDDQRRNTRRRALLTEIDRLCGLLDTHGLCTECGDSELECRGARDDPDQAQDCCPDCTHADID